MRVPHQARIENPGQNSCERIAYCEASTTICHLKGVLHVLIVALRVATYVKPPPVVVLRQGFDQIVHDEDRVVVSEHIPPNVLLVAIDDLLHHARHAYRRSEAPRECVREFGGVFGDDNRRDAVVTGRIGGDAIQESECARAVGRVPESDVGLAARPGTIRGGDSEEKVAAREWRLGRALEMRDRSVAVGEKVEDEEKGKDQEEGFQTGGIQGFQQCYGGHNVRSNS